MHLVPPQSQILNIGADMVTVSRMEVSLALQDLAEQYVGLPSQQEGMHKALMGGSRHHVKIRIFLSTGET